MQRLGDGAATANPILACTCAPVRDYSGREVARIGLFAHAADERDLVDGRIARRSTWHGLLRLSSGTSRPPRLR